MFFQPTADAAAAHVAAVPAARVERVRRDALRYSLTWILSGVPQGSVFGPVLF